VTNEYSFFSNENSFRSQIDEDSKKLKIYRNVRDKIDFFITNDLNECLGEINE
jgi:hypothetical protein